MTVQQLKELNEKNGGFFFSTSTMKCFGDNMRSFTIAKDGDGWLLTRKRDGKTWRFKSDGRQDNYYFGE